MGTFRSDVKLALRMLSNNPGFTTIAVVTLALGIAVNATMFSLVSAFLLRRPTASAPDRVVVVSSVNPSGGFLPDASAVSAPNYLAWRQANDVFTELAAADDFRTANLVVPARQSALPGGTDETQPAGLRQPEAVHSAAVSLNYFKVLGVSTQIGRTFGDGEDQPDHAHVVILGYDLWVRLFAADPSVVGRRIRLNREDYTIVGVMPRNFRLLGFIPQLWTPLVLSPADQSADARKDRSLYLFGRLKPGVTVEQARAQFLALAQRAAENFPEVEKGWGAALRTLPDFVSYTFGIRNALAIMMTTVGFVLMIACANVAGLLFARAVGRRKELAIRRSLGAGRFRIVRQLLTEGLLIALLGGAAGLLLSWWGIRFIQAKLTFNEYIGAVPVALDRNVLLFAVAISLLSAVLCSLVPALKASRSDLNTSLKDESRSASSGRSQTRLRTVLVASEIALALVLLIGTALLIRGVFITGHQNLGFRPDHLLTAKVTLDEAHYKQPLLQTQFVKEVISRLQRIPGSQFVAATSDLPATGPGKFAFHIQGQPDLPGNDQRTVIDTVVTSQFFDAASIPLFRGRLFTEMDNGTAKSVVVVNQQFVQRYFPGENPLGRQIRLDLPHVAPAWSEIIGVVGNVKTFSQATRDEPEVYEAFLQRPVSSFSFMLRTAPDPSGATPALRRAIAQVDPELPLSAVMTMPAVLDLQKGGDRLFSQILGVFALLALVLAGIGVYGLIAQSVSQRTREIGIRMAMGAREPHVLRMVVAEGMKISAIGLGIGTLCALPLPKLFESMFYDFPARAPGVYLLVPLILLMIAAFATYLPARRAARVDPMQALRQE